MLQNHLAKENVLLSLIFLGTVKDMSAMFQPSLETLQFIPLYRSYGAIIMRLDSHKLNTSDLEKYFVRDNQLSTNWNGKINVSCTDLWSEQ